MPQKSTVRRTDAPDVFETAFAAAEARLTEKIGRRQELRVESAQLRHEIAELQQLLTQLRKQLPTAALAGERVASAIPNGSLQPDRGKPAFGRVIRVMFQTPKKAWRVQELRAELASHGVEADPRYLYSVMQHLWERGAVSRVQRGMYEAAVNGAYIDPAWIDDGE